MSSQSCPAHDDHDPSLAIRGSADGRVLVRCHAGCPQTEVVTALARLGLWGEAEQPRLQGRPLRDVLLEPKREDRSRSEAAIRLWQASTPAHATTAQGYLRSRRIELDLPPAIRFHQRLKHPSGGTWPAMIALVSDGLSGRPVAIHRTFLSPVEPKKASVVPSRMMLGPCRGGAVRLAEPTGVLMVGEGIETCLAAMQATGHAAWAALSAPGLRRLELPMGIADIVVLVDGDDAGEAAAREAGTRWLREGRRVRLARPPRGLDFNDLLMGRDVRRDGGMR